jgi:S-adenosylmethionine:tRNA ribosyltransferase-isomerase
MRTTDFDFQFPKELIAYEPLPRGTARLLVVNRDGELDPVHTLTANFGDYLLPGDALVLNDTKVLRARLKGLTPSGSKAEALLLRAVPVLVYAPTATLMHQQPAIELGEGTAFPLTRWVAMVKPAKRFHLGDRITFSSKLVCTVSKVLDDGSRHLDFELPEQEFLSELESVGQVPLPPYIKREANPLDETTYQSVFAVNPGSVAAPTASLHLSEAMLDALEARGVKIVKVTLHVGAGTFQPVKGEFLADHSMHSEHFELSQASAKTLNSIRSHGGKVWAVGTTVARVLETQALGSAEELFLAGSGETKIFIYPGYTWKGVDGLLTNFHWPKSTLFMLTCSLLGTERAKSLYAKAFEQGYRLFSYGDAMLIR